MKINKTQIKLLLKQQKPFLFVDEAEIINDTEIIGKFKLEENANILNGHFPDFPILPGVIAIEMMAQTGLLLSAFRENLTNNQYDTYFVRLDSVSFKSYIAPPAELEIRVKSKPSVMPNFYEASASIFQGKARKCFGDMIFYFKKKENLI